ncbi:MAG: CinA family protein [Nitrospiria bacterium]
MDEPVFHRTIKMTGVSPSDLICWLKTRLGETDLQYEIVEAPAVFDLLLTSNKPAFLDAAVAAVEREWGGFCFANPRERLEEKIGKRLLSIGQTIAVAESCTGGRIASRLTSVPGSSQYFESACVSYSNRAKEWLLSVPPALINEKGAVSKEVASAMAEGIRVEAGVDIGLAVTGIAGPGGGSRDKPVGLVYISLSDHHQTSNWEYRLRGDRETIQSEAAQTALELLRQYLAGGFEGS